MNPDHADRWKQDAADYVDKPPEIRYGIPMPSEEEYVEQLAQELLEGKGELSRKNIEAYMKVRDSPEKARSFLQTLLEADDKDLLYPNEEDPENGPPLNEQIKVARYDWPVRELEELFHLDMWIKAVKLLKQREQ